MSRVLFRAGNAANRLTISDHPSSPTSVVVEVVAGGKTARLTLGRAEVGTGMLAAITGRPVPVPAGLPADDPAGDGPGFEVTEHVHDFYGGRPRCQIAACTTERPAGRDLAEPHVCDFDADGNCLY